MFTVVVCSTARNGGLQMKIVSSLRIDSGLLRIMDRIILPTIL